MSWRVTLALSVALAAAALYAWLDAAPNLFDLDQPTPPDQEVPQLLKFEASEVVTLRLQQKDLKVEVRRENGKWRNVARPRVLEDFLQNVQTMGRLRVLDVPPEELAEYGLDPPAGKVEILARNGDRTVILIGDRNPAGTGAYVRLGEGQPVTLTGSLLLWEFEKAVKAALNR